MTELEVGSLFYQLDWHRDSVYNSERIQNVCTEFNFEKIRSTKLNV